MRLSPSAGGSDLFGLRAIADVSWRKVLPTHKPPWRTAAFSLSAALVATCAHAQQPPAPQRLIRSAPVTVITASITLDGVLVQRQPDPGQDPTEMTEVTLLRDQSNLYVGIVAHDSEPERVIGTQMVRDGSLATDDRIEI